VPPPHDPVVATHPLPTATPGAVQTVTVGLYLQNIPEIDIKTNSFSAEIYL